MKVESTTRTLHLQYRPPRVDNDVWIFALSS